MSARHNNPAGNQSSAPWFNMPRPWTMAGNPMTSNQGPAARQYQPHSWNIEHAPGGQWTSSAPWNTQTPSTFGNPSYATSAVRNYPHPGLMQQASYAQPTHSPQKWHEPPSPSKTVCMYGTRCTRPGCWYQHPHGRHMDTVRSRSPRRHSRRRRSRRASRSPSARSSPTHTTPDSPVGAALPAGGSDNPSASNDSIHPGEGDIKQDKEISSDDDTGLAQAPMANKFAGIGLMRLTQASLPTAEEQHPSYSLTRDSIPVWPQCIDPKRKKLIDSPYQGGGWPIHFRNPAFPRKPVNEVDLRRVLFYLRDNNGLYFTDIVMSTAGVVQAKFGIIKGSGSVQLYTQKFGQRAGNARICVGSMERLTMFRNLLFKSQWFADANGTNSGLGDSAYFVYQPDGMLLLPALSNPPVKKDILTVMKEVVRSPPGHGIIEVDDDEDDDDDDEET